MLSCACACVRARGPPFCCGLCRGLSKCNLVWVPPSIMPSTPTNPRTPHIPATRSITRGVGGHQRAGHGVALERCQVEMPEGPQPPATTTDGAPPRRFHSVQFRTSGGTPLRTACTACHGVTLWSVWSAPLLPARTSLPREGRSPCAHRVHRVHGIPGCRLRGLVWLGSRRANPICGRRQANRRPKVEGSSRPVPTC